MNKDEIPGNHSFRNIHINNPKLWYKIVECELCELYLQIAKNEVAIYFKNKDTSQPVDLEKLYDLPTCEELMIKNLLE